MTKDEAMQMALDVLQALNKDGWILADFENQVYAATDALRTALAQPDTQIGITYEEANPPKPYCKRCGKKLGTEVTDIHTCTPIKKEWVGLTDEEINAIGLANGFGRGSIRLRQVINTVGAKLKEKND